MPPSAVPDFHHGLPGHSAARLDPARLQTSLERLRIGNPKTIRLRNFPDFLILGPQRTGTTWLFHNLKKHPQIFLPSEKETFYFTTLGRPEHPRHRHATLDAFLDESMRDPPRHWFKRQYDCLRKYGEPYHPIMRGEATATNALIPTESIREITAIRPGLKAILMLRDPVDRAWSHARKDLIRNPCRRLGDIPREELGKFFRAAGQRALADYATQIRRWSACLKPGHLFVGEFETVASAPGKLMTEIHRFLGVRSGPKYFNRHLWERINTSCEESEQRRIGIPAEIRDYLGALLAAEREQYHRIRATLDPSIFHRTIRDRDLTITPPRPQSGRFDPAA